MRFERLAGMAGIGFVLLLLGGNLVLISAGFPSPSDAMSFDEIAKVHASESGALRLTSALLPVAWLLGTIFAAGTFTALRRHGRTRGAGQVGGAGQLRGADQLRGDSQIGGAGELRGAGQLRGDSQVGGAGELRGAGQLRGDSQVGGAGELRGAGQVGGAGQLRGDGWVGGDGWAVVGLAGILMQCVAFAGVGASRLAVASAASQGLGAAAQDPGAAAQGLSAVAGLWGLHNALFGFNQIFLATALLGLSVSGRRLGLVSRWHAAVGLLGAALLFLAATSSPYGNDGVNPLALLGLIGWLLWLLWIVAYGIILIRNPEPNATPPTSGTP